MATEDLNTRPFFLEIVSEIAKGGGFTDETELSNRLSREMSLGSRSSIFSDILYGFNRRQQGNPVPANSDVQGLTFFTRPNLNLSYDNIAQVRNLTPLLTTDVNTYQRAIRVLLDPTGENGDRYDKSRGGKSSAPSRGVTSPKLVDPNQPFIPLLSNALISCTGWPDIALNTYSTNEGVAKESWMMNDSIADHHGRFQLNCSFQNMLGDPITLIFYVWLKYMGYVYTGKMVPYPHCVIENEIDYMTRIYRFVMDYSGRYIQKWAACGASMPTALTIGSAFNYSRDNPLTEENQQIGIPFECVGAMYNDPIVLDEFNRLVVMFNPSMEDGVRSTMYTQIPFEYRNLFNYNGYPRINLKTNELQWWVDTGLYKNYLTGSFTTTAPNTAIAAAPAIAETAT